jgi:hypothetical protein
MPKKKLSKADLELLASRGKVKSLTTNRDFEMPESWKGYKSKKQKKNEAVALHKKAHEAGMKALESCVPTPMMVAQHENMLDDNSPVAKAWHVPDGVCGFAWIIVKCNTAENRSFISGLKKAGMAGGQNSFRAEWNKDSYYGGFRYSVMYGNQSYEKKVAYASAFVEVLTEAGINAWLGSNLD